jgi:hypothetical protein
MSVLNPLSDAVPPALAAAKHSAAVLSSAQCASTGVRAASAVRAKTTTTDPECDPAPFTIAILDSGVDSTHQEFINGTRSLVTGDQPTGAGSASHCWHGTAVAGIVATQLHSLLDDTDVASSVLIRSYRITNESGAVDESRIVAAMKDAMAQGVRVINLSASWSHRSTPLREALLLAKPGAVTAAGALVVVTSPGYLTRAGAQYPGIYADEDDCDFLVTVAGFSMQRLLPHPVETADDCKRLDKSCTPKILAAPGKDIHTTLPGNRYGKVRGDSFAAPFVTGLAAAMLLQPGYLHLTASRLRTLLFDGSRAAPAYLRNLGGGTGIHCIANARFIERLNSLRVERR